MKTTTIKNEAAPSLTLAIGHLIGDSTKAMHEAAHYRRASAAHDLIADFPADAAEEAAIIAVHSLGYLISIDSVDITEADAQFIRGELDRAIAGVETVMLFLVRISGIDYVAIAGNYFANIDPVDNDPVTTDDSEGRGAA